MKKGSPFTLNPVASAVLLTLSIQFYAAGAFAGPGLGTSTYADHHLVPTYYANSPSGMRMDPLTNTPISTGLALRKFVDPLPQLCSPGAYPTVTGGNGVPLANKCLPVAVANKTTYKDADYYEIGVVEYTEFMHADLPKPTQLRGYVQLNDPANPVTRDAAGNIIKWPTPHYLGPVIVAERGRAVRVKLVNLLPAGQGVSVRNPQTGKIDFIGPRNGDLFLPVDRTLMGAGLGPDGASMFLQNRIALHLHGGDTPWISDGTPHQWIVPAADETALKNAGKTAFARGASSSNVPDMPDPGPGAATFYFPNNLSARLMFYHDHAAGITRLNVYAGMAAGYLIGDPVERGLVAQGALPADTIPLVIQEKTFVPMDIASQDAKWNQSAWGAYGDLWFPHVYETNQDPQSGDGTNPAGRWDWGPWFWPVFPSLYALPSGDYGDVTTTPEAFMDTPVINGTAYPYLAVEPKAYRFRILNVTNDRFLNLGLYQADTSTAACAQDQRCNTEVNMVPFDSTYAGGFPATGGLLGSGWGQPDSRPGGVPNPALAGPNILQIGTEGGFLPQMADVPSTPINYEYNRRSVTVLNILEHGLLMGPAERADVVIDFSKYAGQTLILYNDAPAPAPAADPRIDYFTDPAGTNTASNYATGGAMPTQAGYGPNTRTIMQIRVASQVTVAPTYQQTTTGEFDKGFLASALPWAYAQSQEKPVVPQTAYNAAFPGIASTDQYATISTGSLQQPTFDFVPANASALGGINLTAPGSGYVTQPKVRILDSTGTGAIANAVMKIGHISVTASGSGYLNAPGVTIATTGQGNGAAATAFLKMTGVKSLSGGSGYASGKITVAIAPPTGWTQDQPGSVRATATATVTKGAISRITITNPGAGYTSLPTIQITPTPGAAGSGAQAVLDAGVERIDLTSPQPNQPGLAGGRGYSDMSLVTVTLSGGGAGGAPTQAATATATGAVAEVALSSTGSGYVQPTIQIDAPSAGWPKGYVLPGDVAASTAMASASNLAKMTVQNKAIQELFEPNYGRMNATLGVELPYTSSLNQTTIPLGYIDPATESFTDGETQIWKITHNGVDSHPVHFHLVNLQLVNRIGWDGTIKPPRANELGWKETIMMNPLEDIVVVTKAKKPTTAGFGLPLSVRLMDPTQPRYAVTGFTQVDPATGNRATVFNDLQTYNWEYVWHCHILGHEENDFMRPLVFDAKEAVPVAPTVTALLPAGQLPAGASVLKVPAGATVSQLSWVDNAATEYKYVVSRSVNGGAFQDLGTALANATGITLPTPLSIPKNTAWVFAVRAVGANGTGETRVTLTTK